MFSEKSLHFIRIKSLSPKIDEYTFCHKEKETSHWYNWNEMSLIYLSYFGWVSIEQGIVGE